MSIVVEDDVVRIERFDLGLFGTNSYIVVCQATNDSVLIDAPADAKLLLGHLAETNPKYILMTHNHFDHVGALREIKSALGVPVAAHSYDADGLPASTDIFIGDGDTLLVGKLELSILHTPGHTPGSLCFLVNSYLLSGDTIFPGGPGRTGTPSDFNQIVKSITSKVFILPEKTWIYPGHGEATILKREKDAFAHFSSQEHSPGLCGEVLWGSP
ncbi:MAG: MBL fold metallo-hydrolase [Chloroflexota bacterium]|nr:MBL fold metallo-hydrolase [Chloroflexota bacterium]